MTLESQKDKLLTKTVQIKTCTVSMLTGDIENSGKEITGVEEERRSSRNV